MDSLLDTASAPLGDPLTFSHMDPPASKIAAYVAGRNAELNQNLLHPSLSPLAIEAERCVLDWLCPFFHMETGLFCSGSSIANLTALWCAREHGATRIVSSADAHLSVAKSAHILGLRHVQLPVDRYGKIELSNSELTTQDCLVLTAGTTGRGAIDTIEHFDVQWLHVDAAWAGPLRLSKYADRLLGLEYADSVAVSAHKWFYQPKESAMVLFKDTSALRKLSFGGAYLAASNIGVQGSRGAVALALLATLMSEGLNGIAKLIEKNMNDAEVLAQYLEETDGIELRQKPDSGVLNWRPMNRPIDAVSAELGLTSSKTEIDGLPWLRQVAVNPFADIQQIIKKISEATQK